MGARDREVYIQAEGWGKEKEAERVRREGQMSQQKGERHCCRSKGDASQLFDAQGTELA